MTSNRLGTTTLIQSDLSTDLANIMAAGRVSVENHPLTCSGKRAEGEEESPKTFWRAAAAPDVGSAQTNLSWAQ